MQASLDASDEVRLCALMEFIACQLSPLDGGVSLQEGVERACEEMTSESNIEVVSKAVGSKPVVPQQGEFPASAVPGVHCEALAAVQGVLRAARVHGCCSRSKGLLHQLWSGTVVHTHHMMCVWVYMAHGVYCETPALHKAPTAVALCMPVVRPSGQQEVL